eukprot:766413-Rhodomonas_salina.4
MNDINIYRVLITGSRGAGKTSIFNALLGCLPARSQGELRVIGVPSTGEVVRHQLDGQAQLLGMSTEDPDGLSQQLCKTSFLLRRVLEENSLKTAEQLVRRSTRIKAIVLLYDEGELCPFAQRSLTGAIDEVRRVVGVDGQISHHTRRRIGDQPYDLVCLARNPIRHDDIDDDELRRLNDDLRGFRNIYFDNTSFPPVFESIMLPGGNSLQANVNAIVQGIKELTEECNIDWIEVAEDDGDDDDDDDDDNNDGDENDDDDDDGYDSYANADDHSDSYDNGDAPGGGNEDAEPSVADPGPDDANKENVDPSNPQLPIRVEGPGFGSAFPMFSDFQATAHFPRGPIAPVGFSLGAINSDLDWERHGLMYALVDSGSSKHYLCARGRSFLT